MKINKSQLQLIIELVESEREKVSWLLDDDDNNFYIDYYNELKELESILTPSL